MILALDEHPSDAIEIARSGAQSVADASADRNAVAVPPTLPPAPAGETMPSAFTGELSVRFEKPAPLGVPLEFRGRQVRAEGRRRYLEG